MQKKSTNYYKVKELDVHQHKQDIDLKHKATTKTLMKQAPLSDANVFDKQSSADKYKKRIVRKHIVDHVKYKARDFANAQQTKKEVSQLDALLVSKSEKSKRSIKRYQFRVNSKKYYNKDSKQYFNQTTKEATSTSAKLSVTKHKIKRQQFKTTSSKKYINKSNKHYFSDVLSRTKQAKVVSTRSKKFVVRQKNKIYFSKNKAVQFKSFETSVILKDDQVVRKKKFTNQKYSYKLYSKAKRLQSRKVKPTENLQKRIVRSAQKMRCTSATRFSEIDATLKHEHSLTFRPTRKYLAKKKDNFVKESAKSISKKSIRIVRRSVYQQAHNKAEEIGEDSVSFRAAHRTEQTAERSVKLVRRYNRFKKKIVSKREHRKLYKKNYTEAKSKLYEKSRLQSKSDLVKQPKLFIKNKYYQKKKMYAATAKKYVEQAKAQPINFLIKISRELLIRNKVLLGGIAVLFVLVIIVPSILSMLVGSLLIGAMTTYPSDRAELDKIVEYLTEQDSALVAEFDAMGSGYDAYSLTYAGTGVIATNPTHMLSFLTVVLEDAFTFDEVKGIIDNMYLKLYAYESKVIDEGSDDTSYYHLYVTVNCKTLIEVIEEENLLTEEQREWFDLLNQTGGNYLGGNLGNPFPGFDWTPNVTDTFGFRIHPVTGKIGYHEGLDIGIAADTPICAVQNGTVIEAVHGDRIFGNYVVIDDGTVKTKYAHANSLLVNMGDVVKLGDQIALVGTTGMSTGNHLHIEVYIASERVDPFMQLSTN